MAVHYRTAVRVDGPLDGSDMAGKKRGRETSKSPKASPKLSPRSNPPSKKGGASAEDKELKSRYASSLLKTRAMFMANREQKLPTDPRRSPNPPSPKVDHD